MTKYIHAFSDPITDEIDQSLIGNKGYNLCLMHGMDLPIPEGFIINAKAAKEFKKNFLGKIPISTKLRESADLGLPLAYKEPNDEISKIFLEIADKVMQDVV